MQRGSLDIVVYRRQLLGDLSRELRENSHLHTGLDGVLRPGMESDLAGDVRSAVAETNITEQTR